MMPTAEQRVLAEAILRHRPLALTEALRAALRAAGEDVPAGEETSLHAYADAIAIDMVPDGFRYVSRDGVPLPWLITLPALVAEVDARIAACARHCPWRWIVNGWPAPGRPEAGGITRSRRHDPARHRFKR